MLDEQNVTELLREPPRRDLIMAGVASLVLVVFGIVALPEVPRYSLLAWSSVLVLLWGALSRLLRWVPGWSVAWLALGFTGIAAALAWQAVAAGPVLALVVFVVAESVILFLAHRVYRWLTRLRQLALERRIAAIEGPVR